MKKFKVEINSTERTITINGVKMNQNGFSYNSITFNKIDDDTIIVMYKKQIVENTQEDKDLSLSWALSDVLNVINKYSQSGWNPYDKDYKMFEINC